MINSMKITIILLALCFGVNAQSVVTNAITTSAIAIWTDPDNDPADIIGYMVYIADNLLIFNVSSQVTEKQCDLIPLLLQVPNGEYRVWVTAINRGGVESQPSETLWFFWYGHPPNPPGPIEISFIKP